VQSFGDHDIFIADVVMIHNKQLSDNPKPILFLGKGYYDTSTQNLKRFER